MDSLQAIDDKLDCQFGFHSSHLLSTHHNARLHLGSMPVWFYFQRPSNLTCHNLATTHQPPLNFCSLLSLRLSFCPQLHYTLNSNLNQMLDWLHKDLYNCYVYAGDNNDNYDPKLYARSDRNPPVHLVSTELI